MVDSMFKVTVKTEEGDETVYIKHYIDIVYPCYEQFKQKIYTRYPNLREANVKMYWIDSENDQVLVFNEEDFRVYVDQVQSPKDKFYIELVKKSVPAPINVAPKSFASVTLKDEIVHPQHVGVICDGCDNNIVGYRYKCLECSDFDLCMKCESQFMHRNHTMLRFYMPAQYVDWAGCKFAFGKFAKCSRKKYCDIPKEFKKAMKHDEKSERRHKHRCHDKNIAFSNIMGCLHEMNNEVGADKTTGDSTSEPQTAANHQHAAQQNMEKAFKMFGHFMKPFVLDVDMEIHGVQKKDKPEETKKHEKSDKSESKKVKKMKHDDKNDENAATFFGPAGSHNIPSEDNSEEQQSSTIKEPIVHQIPITLENSTENVPKIYYNPFENSEPKTEFFFIPTNEQKTSQDSSIDSEKEWDVIDEEIALENLEKRRNSPPSNNNNNTGTIPKENLTKNSSTNTSIDDIPKMTQSKESDKKSSAYESAQSASESNVNFLNNESNASGNHSPMVMHNFEQLGRDLKKHIDQQWPMYNHKVVNGVPIIPSPIIYHPKSHINDSIQQMIQMGFSNEGGWLTQLLDSVNGNIPKALDLLQPVRR